jgi:N-acetylglutamate synthase-like GNAT family acetyltransferase
MDKRSVTAAEATRIERVELADACWLHVAVDDDDEVVGTVAVDASAGDVARISWLVVDGSRVDAAGVGAALVAGAAAAARAAGCTRLEARPHPRWAALGFSVGPDGKAVRELA